MYFHIHSPSDSIDPNCHSYKYNKFHYTFRNHLFDKFESVYHCYHILSNIPFRFLSMVLYLVSCLSNNIHLILGFHFCHILFLSLRDNHFQNSQKRTNNHYYKWNTVLSLFHPRMLVSPSIHYP